MQQGALVELDRGLALEAAEVGAELGLPLADSIIYATALRHEATLWTPHADFQGLSRVEYREKS